MDLGQFGQTIKDKYPQYHDMSNEEVGAAMLQKYPQYKDMVQAPSTGIDSLLDKSGLGILKGVVKPATDFYGAVDMAGRAGMNALGMGDHYPTPNESTVPIASAENEKQLADHPVSSAVGDVGTLAQFVPGLNELGAIPRAVVGAVSGGANEMANPDASPLSVASAALTNGGLNAVLPGASEQGAKILGETSLGKGGSKIPEISKVLGTNIMGSAEKVAHQVSNSIADTGEFPLTTILRSVLQKSPGTIGKNEIFDAIDNMVAKSGPAEKQSAKDYATMLKISLNDAIMGHFPESGALQNTNAPQRFVDKATGRPVIDIGGSNPQSSSIGKTQDSHVKLPLDLVDNWLDTVGRDVKNYWEKDYVPISSNMAKNINGKFSSLIADRSGDPQLVNGLNQLRLASSQISKGAQSAPIDMNPATLLKAFKNLGLPGSAITSLLMGNIPGVLAAGAGEVATHAGTATPIMSGLNSGVNKNILIPLVSKIAGQGAGNIANPQ